MIGNLFHNWVRYQLQTSLVEPSIAVWANAPYHSVLKKKQTASYWRKQEIKDWRTTKKINFPETAFKLELLKLAKTHKEPNIFIVDEMIQEHGH